MCVKPQIELDSGEPMKTCNTEKLVQENAGENKY